MGNEVTIVVFEAMGVYCLPIWMTSESSNGIISEEFEMN